MKDKKEEFSEIELPDLKDLFIELPKQTTKKRKSRIDVLKENIFFFNGLNNSGIVLPNGEFVNFMQDKYHKETLEGYVMTLSKELFERIKSNKK